MTVVARQRQNWGLFFVLVAVAFAVISLGTWWAANDLGKMPEWDKSAPMFKSTISSTPTPTPAPTTPSCPEGYKWSKHASKCYIPPVELPHKINAVPKSTFPTSKNGS